MSRSVFLPLLRIAVVALILCARSTSAYSQQALSSDGPTCCNGNGKASSQAADQPISADQIEAHVRHLASDDFEGRQGANAIRAAAWIADQFEQLGLKPVLPDDSYRQDIPGRPDDDGGKTIIGQNVVGLLPGSDPELADEYLLLGAHHDHIGKTEDGIFYGADDNASGVAMVLAVAKRLSQSGQRPRRSVLFVSFDVEEHLLFGSRWFAAHPPVPLEKTRLVVVADMLGRSLGDLPLNSVFLFGAEHGTGLRSTVESLQSTFQPQVKPVLLSASFVGTRSDYAPFRDRDIPFLFASTGQSPDYHKMGDTADKLDYEQITAISTGLAKLLQQVANTETPPEWIAEPEISRDEVQAVLNIVTVIEQHADSLELSTVQKLFVAQTRFRAEQLLKADTISPGDEAWLTRATQMMLFTVF